jgi:hypothetical protein
MAVFWTIQARRHLRQALARALGRESEEANAGTGIGKPAGTGSGLCLNVLDVTMDRLNDILAATFEGMSLVVKDQVLGYRRREDLFILMVESFGKDDSQQSGPFVVKVGRESRIKKELEGWRCCRPPGLKHDMVFLDLRAGESLDVDGEMWMSLVYGDAQQFLGVTVTIPFEKAALECIRSGFPRLLSIGFVIVELFERIGHLLYSQGFVDDPAQSEFVFSLPKLENSLQRWETEPSCQTARRDVNALAASGVERFLDPIDYLRYVQAYVPWKSVRPNGTTETRSPAETAEAAEPTSLPRPTVTDLVPRMLRGCAHGDLHGRNILVGIVRDQAMWPTVFDYEDMGPSNLVGWDFVKLETELKMRAALDVFGGGPPAKFVQQVQRFETGLNAMTEDCHRNRSWPDAGDPATPEERLRAILLLIRRMAAHHLGVNHGRPNDWLEEYYFLLACYGTFTGRFENLQPRERIGALLSAGVATSRLSWPRRLG